MLTMKSKCNGFTLIELLIAAILGIFITGSIITVFATTVKYNSDNLQMIRLNQELRGAMSLISRDLRRAGYFNSGSSITTTYLHVFDGFDDCIHFAYDINSNGAVDDSDYIAFKLEGNEIVVGQQEAGKSIDCTDDSTVDWQESITKYNSGNDRSGIKITKLEFKPECSLVGGTVSPTFDCVAGDNVEVRNVRITIEGEVTPEVSRTLEETVKLRNDGGV